MSSQRQNRRAPRQTKLTPLSTRPPTTKGGSSQKRPANSSTSGTSRLITEYFSKAPRSTSNEGDKIQEEENPTLQDNRPVVHRSLSALWSKHYQDSGRKKSNVESELPSLGSSLSHGHDKMQHDEWTDHKLLSRSSAPVDVTMKGSAPKEKPRMPLEDITASLGNRKVQMEPSRMPLSLLPSKRKQSALGGQKQEASGGVGSSKSKRHASCVEHEADMSVEHEADTPIEHKAENTGEFKAATQSAHPPVKQRMVASVLRGGQRSGPHRRRVHSPASQYEAVPSASDLVDDELYMPAEGEGLENEDQDDYQVSKDARATFRQLYTDQQQRRILATSKYNADAYLAELNQEYPVAADDPDMARFERSFRRAIERLDKRTKRMKSRAWFELPREDREMTMAFMEYLSSQKDHTKLAKCLLSRMPDKTKQVLGRTKKLSDLRDLPVIPEGCKHRLVYADVASRFSREVLDIKQGKVRGNSVCRTTLRDATATPLETNAYIGSTNDAKGGWVRIDTHSRQSTLPESLIDGSAHYHWIRQPDVVPQFSVIAILQNPTFAYVEPTQDVERILTVLLEALIIIYLGFYDEEHMTVHSRFRPAVTFDLARELRDEEFPSLKGLNRALPLMQGVAGGTKRVQRCSHCRRPIERRYHKQATVQPDFPGIEPSTQVHGFNTGALMPEFICHMCYQFWYKHQKLPDRQGTVDGKSASERHYDLVNEAWFLAGNERACHNPACENLLDGKTIYGLENGIRCERCQAHRYAYKEDWHPESPQLPYDPARIRQVKDFSESAHTVPVCANVDCLHPDLEKWKPCHYPLIEDIESHIWRCPRCDWAYHIVKKVLGRKDVHLNGPPLHEPPSGPIAAHRFNETKCSGCGSFCTWGSWEKQGDGTWRCSECVGMICQSCGISQFWTDVSRVDGLCGPCKRSKKNHGNTAQPRTTIRNSGTIAPRTPGTYEVPGCNTTWTGTNGSGGTSKNGVKRCKICADYFRLTGFKFDRQFGPCDNCATTQSFKWYTRQSQAIAHLTAAHQTAGHHDGVICLCGGCNMMLISLNRRGPDPYACSECKKRFQLTDPTYQLFGKSTKELKCGLDGKFRCGSCHKQHKKND